MVNGGRESGNGSSLVGSRGEALIGGPGDEIPQQLKPFCKLIVYVHFDV